MTAAQDERFLRKKILLIHNNNNNKKKTTIMATPIDEIITNKI